MTALIEAGFDTLVKGGYQPEIAYFECLHELKLIVDLIQKGGMMNMWTTVSNTAEYGGLSTRDKVINDETKKAMEKMLEDIKAGKFAKEWLKDANGGMKKLQSMEKEEAESEIEVVGKEIRALFEIKGAPKAKKAAPKKAPAKKVAAKKGNAKTAAPAKKALDQKGSAEEGCDQEEGKGIIACRGPKLLPFQFFGTTERPKS